MFFVQQSETKKKDYRWKKSTFFTVQMQNHITLDMILAYLQLLTWIDIFGCLTPYKDVTYAFYAIILQKYTQYLFVNGNL